MNVYGRITRIKRTKNNVFITIENYKRIQLVVKRDLIYVSKDLVIGDVVSCLVDIDDNNNGKYKCDYETFKLINLKVISKNVRDYHIKFDYDNLKKYSEAKFRVRNFLRQRDYLEVNVPILTDGETSSKATSFETKYSKTEKKLFLRKTMDTFLRMFSCNNLNKIYAIGPCFRNEYVTSKNVSEFEMLSIFTNYMNQKEAIELALSLLKVILNQEEIIIKYVTEKEYSEPYEENVFYVINCFENLSNSYSNISEDGTTDEFKIKYNNITIVHGIMEISNIEEYLNKISVQGKKENYGELQKLENCINSGAPICYNLGISIIRILSVFYKNKISDYDIFSFTRLNLKKGENNE